MRYAEAISDIEIARAALKDSLLYDAYSEVQLVMEYYVIPAHNHYTFFARIYNTLDGYKMIYARTEITYANGLISVMDPFSRVLDSERVLKGSGKIISGIANISDVNKKRIQTLNQNLPLQDYTAECSKIVIDGSYQHFSFFNQGSFVREIAFLDVSELEIFDLDSEQLLIFDQFNFYLEADMDYKKVFTYE